MFKDTRIDYYDWLRDNNWPEVKNEEVLKYLNDENSYADNTFFNKNKDLTEKIFQELKNRIKEDDQTVPVKVNDYYYFSYIKKGQNY